MAVTLIKSTDGGAPALTGEVGKLVNETNTGVLDYCLVTALGWTKDYHGTNKGVFRPPAGNRFYLRISDEGAGAANYARMVGYETMSDVDTGTGPFPTNTQASGGLYLMKAAAANNTQRPWVFVGDDKIFYLLTDYNSDMIQSQGYCFGTFPSRMAGDIYNTLITGNTGSNGTSGTLPLSTVPGLITNFGKYISRRYDNTLGAVLVNTSLMIGPSNGSSQWSGAAAMTLQYPDPITGSFLISPLCVCEYALQTVVRGTLPGMWHLLMPFTFNHLDTMTGQAGTDLEGKTFLFHKMYTGATIAIETSDTWYD
jgi:hypothetical protein